MIQELLDGEYSKEVVKYIIYCINHYWYNL